LARDRSHVAVLLSERGLGGSDTDLDQRLRRWRGDGGKRAEAARGLAKRWLSLLPGGSRDKPIGPRPSHRPGTSDVGACIALAFPDRIAKRRDQSGEHWLSAGGRGFRLDPASPLARESWLAVAEVGGTAVGARILSAAAIDQAQVEALFANRIEPGPTSASIPQAVPSRPGAPVGSARSRSAKAATRRQRPLSWRGAA
jgi:ATP-dependent helicase HrpB